MISMFDITDKTARSRITEEERQNSCLHRRIFAFGMNPTAWIPWGTIGSQPWYGTRHRPPERPTDK